MKNLIIPAILFLISCRVADFTMLSTKNVDSKTQYVLLGRSAKGSGTLKGATDKTIESLSGGVYLENVVILKEPFGRWRVKGDVWGVKQNSNTIFSKP